MPSMKPFCPIFSIGRYVVIHYGYQEIFGLEHSLMFMDIKMQQDLIQELKTIPQFSNNQDYFTSFLDDYNSMYDTSKDAFKLFLGDSSIQRLASNMN